MADASGKAKSASFDALIRRVKSLEQQLGKARVQAAAAPESKDERPHLNIMEELSEITQSLRSKQEADFDKFFEQYSQLQRLIEATAPLESLLLTDAQKERVIITADSDVHKTAAMLEQVQKDESLIDKVPIENLPKVMQQTSKAESYVFTKLTETAELHDGVENFLDAYNGLIDSYSRQLIAYNAKLSAWEQKVDDKLREKGKL